MIRQVLSGGDYDNIMSDELALQRAKLEIYWKCRLNDSIALTCIPIPWVDVNILVSHAPKNSIKQKKYMVKSFHASYGDNTTMTINAISYYAYYSPTPKPEPILPEGYTQLDYIQSTGTQYINTGVLPTASTKFQFAVTMKALTGDVIIGDMTNDRNDYRIFNYQGAVYWDMGSSRLIASANSLPVGERAEFEVGNNYVKKNDVMLISGNALTSLSIQQTINVFGTGQGTCKAVIEYLTIWDGDAKVRDFVPCKNPSGTVGLYDLVGGEFYGNSGTGTFIAGEEVTN